MELLENHRDLEQQRTVGLAPVTYAVCPHYIPSAALFMWNQTGADVPHQGGGAAEPAGF